MERRIAAIFAADMVGFSRLVEADETGTLTRQKRHRAELIDPAITRHNGNIVKLTGDGMICEFASVVDAVQCAVFIQQEMVAREEDVPEDKKIRYRVAVNLGDVIFDEGDVYGDGVNIAARLEALAEPGGVVVSGTAYDLLKANVEVGYQALGEKKVKNIATRVRVYRVIPDGHGVGPARPKRQIRWIAAAATIIAVAAVLAGGWYLGPVILGSTSTAPEAGLSESPSIAVMPFGTIGDGEETWLADSLSDEISSVLATLASSESGRAYDILVIGRRASQRLADATPAEISQKLGVRHILDGDVRTGDGRMVVAARLIDATDGSVVWSDRYDRKLEAASLFDVHDEIVKRIFVELQVETVHGNYGRAFFEALGDLEAIRLGAKMDAELSRLDAEGLRLAYQTANELLEKRPNNVIANGYLGWVLSVRVVLGMSENRQKDLDDAAMYAEKALAIDPEFGWSHSLGAYVYAVRGEYERAMPHADRAIELSGDAVVPSAGNAYLWGGNYEKAATHFRRMVRVQPFAPDYVRWNLGQSLMFLGRLDEAREVFEGMREKGIQLPYFKFLTDRNMIILTIWEGKPEEARSLATAFVEKYGEGATINRIKQLLGVLQDKELVERMIEALLEAGIPASLPPDVAGDHRQGD